MYYMSVFESSILDECVLVDCNADYDKCGLYCCSAYQINVM